jgi:hypothetical protein
MRRVPVPAEARIVISGDNNSPSVQQPVPGRKGFHVNYSYTLPHFGRKCQRFIRSNLQLHCVCPVRSTIAPFTFQAAP